MASPQPNVHQNQSAVNFTGSWNLRTTENLDAFLQSEGWGFLSRKAASASSATVQIAQDDKKIHIINTNMKGTYEYKTPLDGTEIEYVDNFGDKCRSKTTVSDDGKKIFERVIKKGFENKLTRWMENGEMKLKIENHMGKHCVRIYKKY